MSACRFCNAECGAETQHYCALGERSHPRMLERITTLEQRVARIEATLFRTPVPGELNPEIA